MKKILLAGGAGYIGTELCKRLIKLDYDITVIDDLWFGNNLDSKIRRNNELKTESHSCANTKRTHSRI